MDVRAPIAGRYRIERVLGEGGMGRVYLARHLELSERVAVKVLRGESVPSAGATERMRREARASARMRGENIARVMDAGVCEQHGPFLVMEYVEGRSLSAVLAADGPMPVERAVSLVLQACAGLAEAHSLGVIHRDVKPSNLLLTQRPDGTELLKVVDFGIAKAEALASSTLTDTQGLLGSPKYMSPEQVRGAREVDPRTDVWSLGVVLYELLTGRLPFEAYTAAGVLAQIAADGPTPPRAHEPTLPESLEALILRTLSKGPEGRPASVVELARALAGFAGAPGESRAATVERIAATPRAWSTPPPAPRHLDDVPTTAPPTMTTRGGTREARGESQRVPWRLVTPIALSSILTIVAVLSLRSRPGPSSATAAAAIVAEPAAGLTPSAAASTTELPPSPALAIPSSSAEVASPSASAAAPGTATGSAPDRPAQTTARSKAPRPAATPSPRDLELDFGPRK